MDEEEIIQLYFQRKENALVETANKYGKLLYSVANAVLRNHEDCEETVNDSYLGAWVTIPPQRPYNLTAFLCRITRNLAISRYRKSSAQKRDGILVELTEIIPETETIEDAINLQELTQKIEEILLTWAQEDRVLFLKRYFFCLSLKELSQETGQKERHLASKFYRLRQKLKQKLKEEGYAL